MLTITLSKIAENTGYFGEYGKVFTLHSDFCETRAKADKNIVNVL